MIYATPPPLVIPERPALVRAANLPSPAVLRKWRREDASFFVTPLAGFMAYTSAVAAPLTIEATNSGGSVGGTPVNSFAVPLPASIAANDLLIIFIALASTADATSTPSGWTMLYRTAGSSPLSEVSCYYKVASGSEGSSVTVTCTSNNNWATASYRISGYQGAPEAGTTATGSSVNPNPPSLTPSWGSAANIWLAAEGDRNTVAVSTTLPTNYTNLLEASVNDAGVIRAHLATGRRSLTGSSEDPGAYTISGSNQWGANTVAIRPAS